MAVRPDTRPADLPPRLARLAQRAGLALAVERLWRAATPALVVLAAFLTAAWAGLWGGLTPVGRMAGLGLFGLAFLASIWPFRRLAWPQADEKIARADADSALRHRPAAALSDRLALGPDNADTRLLWRLHQQRSEQALAAARPAAPRARLAERDPWALRTAALLLACGAALFAGPEWRARLMQPFDWSVPVAAGPGSRIDGWIDPPAYTRVAPTILTIAAGETTRTVKAPVNSTLVIRAAGAPDLAISTSGGLAPVETDKKPADGAVEQRWTIREPGAVEVKRGLQILARLTIEPVADQAPTAAMAQPPQGNGRGTLTLNYKLDDDYGLASAEALFERATQAAPAGRPAPRPLVPAPRLPLSLPAEPRGVGEGQSILDLSTHPWAGARVKMTVVARDEAGQEGMSEPVDLTLPQRPFTKPLPKALVELRRTLVLDAHAKPRVLGSLDALMLNPERFAKEAGVYLGLKTAYARLRMARKDPELLDVADYLWGMALHLEDGDLSQAERDLRAAQEALRQALERGASDEEIKRLTQDLRAALDKFMRELAEQMRRDGQQNAQQQRPDPNMRTVRPDDLKRMIDRMEQMARQGARDEARKMLDDLQQMLDNLQTARPNQRGQDPMAREMNRSMEDLDRMIRDQQALRDETFRQGQERRGQQRMDRNRQGQQGQQQQQGQRQRGQRGQQGQQGQQGEQGEGEQENAEGEGQQGQGGQSLAERQQRLREQLEQLRRRMRGLGMNNQQMQEAEEAMREAEGQLGQGGEGQAADAQGRALDALRRGAQSFAQQMMDGLGDPNGDQADAADNDSPGNAPQNRRAGGDANDDPLGRPTRSRDVMDNSRVKVPRPGESASERAQRVLEELRRRLGDPSRPSEELDYFRRLLSPY